MRELSLETVMEGGRQGFQSGAAMLCAIFHSVKTAVLQLLMSYTLHYIISCGLDSLLQSLCHPVAMQRSSKASPKETTD